MRKKVLKAIGIILIVALIIFALYNLCIFIRRGNQIIDVYTNDKYSSDSNIEAIVKVSKDKNNESIDSKLKVELLDSNRKKVKNFSRKYDIKKGNDANISIPIPDNTKTGNYTLRVISNSGIWKDTCDVPISISNGADINTSIVMDKGIYKPGDTINFRALLTSKKDDTPIQKNVQVSIYDGNDNRVYYEEKDASDFGIISGSFKLADEVNSGNYKITVSSENKEQSKIFVVNPYIKPQFEVKIETDKDTYILNENANIKLKAQYFFGEPVANATIKGKIGEKEINAITDSNGEFETQYEVKNIGKSNIEFNVTDTSNYLIEAKKTIIGSTDLFEIDILPENEGLVKGIDNDVYVFTKKANGDPVKTYVYINIDKINRQVITDENGIGKFTLSSEDISSISSVYGNIYSETSSRATLNNYRDSKTSENNKSSAIINITAQDMDKNEVKKQKIVDILENSSTIIKTNKVKYNVGEDININLYSSINAHDNEIYIYKNNELLKAFTTTDSSLTVNLEDVYGLIDIYVPKRNQSYNSYYRNDSSVIRYTKKTIFIKPNKALNIDIETDSEQYKPGDDLNIKFSTVDESNSKVDTALLVSILDEAILNLAENDLSIDNIKLALQDIELTDDMSAADLYTSIIDDNSESTIMGLLLKQTYKDPDIKNSTNSDRYDEKSEALGKTIISSILVVVLIFIYISIKSKGFSEVLLNFFNIICLFGLVSYLYGTYGWINSLVILMIVIAVYLLFLYKFKDKIFMAILELIILPFFAVTIYNLFDLEDFIILIAVIPFLLLAILTTISRKKELNKFFDLSRRFLKTICKIEFIYGIAYFVSEEFYIEEFGLTVLILALYIVTCIILNKKSMEKIKEKQFELNINGMQIVLGVFLLIVAFIAFNLNTFSRPITSSRSSYYDFEYNYNDKGGSITDSVISPGQFSSYGDSVSGESTSSSKSMFDGISDILSSATSKRQENYAEESIEDTIKTENTAETVSTEENIRNVFLDSLAFIPEIVTENGTANAKIKISDNITTWNIQTVGNAKNGSVGYSSSKIKVFKEFFIDFSLPANSVVTDKTNIPVTLYNYTPDNLNIDLNLVENDWSKIGEYKKNVSVPANSTSMIYIPLEIMSPGNKKLRIEAKSNGISDIVEKTMEIKPNGFEESNVISSGTMDKTLSQDLIFKDDIIDGTGKIKVKLYPSPITQSIEGIENIFKMPTGCFEQTSSSLYPNILALKYLQNNKIENQEKKDKALSYISSGYQRLLTFEVKSEKGGYSLYGNAPAESVITAFGLMELKDLSEIYEVDENVLNNMKEFLFKKQKSNGSFDYNSTYIGGASSTNDLAMTAYISWAISESYPEDSRLEKSVKYLENNIDKMTDNYTLALTANVFANTKNKKTNEVVEKLMKNIVVDGEKAYITSNIRDYYGSYGNTQNLQTTALCSMALTKLDSNAKKNGALVNYIISKKDKYGTWGSTQATILSLKAINDFSQNSDISSQTISVKVNDDVKDIEVKENALDIYEFSFDNIKKENKISIELKKGKILYEIIQEYYTEYDKKSLDNSQIQITQNINNRVKLNDSILQNIRVQNNTKETIFNGMVEINIPQGCTVNEDSLMLLKNKKIIEKYEYNYNKIKIYLRNLHSREFKELEIKYRAIYPENITGASIKAYDYYNPEIEGYSYPVNITVFQ